MTDFFAPSNRKQSARRDYFVDRISQYMALNKTGMLVVEFDDSMSYKEVNLETLVDLFEFVYKYIGFFVPSERICPEVVMSVLCLCVPRLENGVPPIAASLEQTRMRLGEKVNRSKRESDVYVAYDRVKDEMTMKNVIDAIKVYYFTYIFENSCDNETVPVIRHFQNEMDAIFQECITPSPRFTYEKEAFFEEEEADDPNAKMLNLSRDEIIQKVEAFLEKNTPQSIYDHLCKYIIGQEQAKKQMSIGVYYYLRKLVTPNIIDTNSNILMVGPSGCGKTEIIRVLQAFLPIPVIIYDVASLTSAAYKGDNKDNILRPLANTDGVALVFLDEFDKICAPSITSSGTNFSYETQGQILSMIEGNTIPIDDGAAYINTRNTMFIAGGAFEGMEIASKKKYEKQKTIGFSSAPEVVNENPNDYRVSITDVIKYGLRVELAGRFASVVTLYALTDEELYGIVVKYVSQYERMIDKEIKFDKDEINKEIKTNVLGCRHIKQNIYEILTNALFDAPLHPDSKTVKLTKENTGYKTEFL